MSSTIRCVGDDRSKKTVNEYITIVIEPKFEGLSVPSAVSAITNLLKILKDVKRNHHDLHDKSLTWKLVKCRMESPLTMTFSARTKTMDYSAAPLINQVIRGFEQLEKSAAMPPGFTDRTIDYVEDLSKILSNSVKAIRIQAEETGGINVTQHTSANISEIKKNFLEREDFATIEGIIKGTNIQERAFFNLFDNMHGRRIECYYNQDFIIDQVRLGKRASVFGIAKYKGKIIKSIDVKKVKWLRDRSQLPQFKGTERVDITGGEDPVELIRRIRDAG